MMSRYLTKSNIMLSLVKSAPPVHVVCRHLTTTQRTNFKFKLTEEMSKEFEEKQRQEAEKKQKPEQALHTKESSLIMGRVSHERYKNVVKCSVPKHRLNEFLMMFVRENDNIQVLDENNISNPGDWVLLRRDENIQDKDVRHRLEKVVYQYGKYIDPITNRRSFGIYYDDDYESLEKIKIDI